MRIRHWSSDVCSSDLLAPREGATVLTGGKPARIEGLEEGYFIEPTIFTDVRTEMQIAQEEIFGPVTCVLRWKDEEELLRQVNDVDYGLAGGIWTRDLTRAPVMARRMEPGIIWINKWYNLRPGVSGGGYNTNSPGPRGGRAR